MTKAEESLQRMQAEDVMFDQQPQHNNHQQDSQQDVQQDEEDRDQMRQIPENSQAVDAAKYNAYDDRYQEGGLGTTEQTGREGGDGTTRHRKAPSAVSSDRPLPPSLLGKRLPPKPPQKKGSSKVMCFVACISLQIDIQYMCEMYRI